MALLFFDGFDAYETVADMTNYVITGVPVLMKNTGRSGKGRCAVSITGATQGVSRFLGNPSGPVTTGFAVFRVKQGTSVPVFYYSVLNGASRLPQITVEFGANGYVTLYRGRSTAILGRSESPVGLASSWQFVEVQAVIHPTAGSVTVRLAGRNILAIENINTQGDPASQRGDTIHFGASAPCYVDDLYVCDGGGGAPYNNFLGVCSVRVRTPTAAGDFTQFLPSTTGRTNFSMVNTPDKDLSYTSASTVGAKDTFVSTMAPLGATETVLGVKVAVVGKKDDNGDRAMAPILRSGTSEATGSTKTLGQTYEVFSDTFLVDPATNAPWTPVSVNNIRFGYKIIR